MLGQGDFLFAITRNITIIETLGVRNGRSGQAITDGIETDSISKVMIRESNHGWRVLAGAIMRFFKSYFQHHFNPLHVYCRLRDCGFSSRFAIRVSSAYERVYRVCSFKTTSRC